MPKYDLATRKFLIDCNVFPGNSGGPVFNNPDKCLLYLDSDPSRQIKFLGIVTKSKFSSNKLKPSIIEKKPTKVDSVVNNMYSLESIGIAVVEPAQNVFDLLKFVESKLKDQ